MAAADYAEGIIDAPPPELSSVWRCRRWNALPRAGGLDDQPLAALVAMETALDTYEVMRLNATQTNSVEFSQKFPRLAEQAARIDHLRETGEWPNE